ncbi:MAG TPA: hypothetical protein VFA55_07590 [Candidatus Kapabacteria bacterium]|nr:hypothetical protein [Candidatus Kapabacteria bacterium]
MMRATTRISLFIAVFFGMTALAQAGGSDYSLFGIGDIMFSPNTRSQGMGNVMAPLWSTFSIIPDNPASWSALQTTKIQGTFQYEGISTLQNSSNAYISTSSIGGAAIAIPLYTPSGITLALGFSPVSEVQYNVSFPTEQTQDTATTYNTQYQGQGGLSKFFIGSSCAPFSWLSLGGALEYNFGSITKTSEALFSTNGLTNGYANTTIYDRTAPDGFDGRFSAMAAFNNFTLSGIVRLPATLKTQYQETTVSSVGGVGDTATTIYYNQTLPLSYTIGAAYQVKDILIAGDYIAEDWNSFLVNGVHPDQIQSSNTISLGIERIGSVSPSASGLERWSLRLGGYYSKTYYVINGTPINEIFTTAGVGFPLGLAGYMDAALQYGTLGTTSNGLVKENIFRLNMTFIMSEKWFIPLENN